MYLLQFIQKKFETVATGLVEAKHGYLIHVIKYSVILIPTYGLIYIHTHIQNDKVH